MKKNSRIAFILSGSGSVIKVILEAVSAGVISNLIPTWMISDRERPSLTLAKEYKLTPYMVPFKKFKTRDDFSNNVLEVLQGEGADFFFMTFDRLLSGPILEEYKNRIINHHPALLPAFPGYAAEITKITNTGTTFTGATCHYIDAGMDTGPIINQCIMPLNRNTPTEKIAHRLFLLRSQLAVQAVYAVSNGLLEVTEKDVYMKRAKYDSYPINPSLKIPNIRKFFASKH